MSASVTVSEARATLPELLGRVLAGEEITLTRHGRPVAVLVRPDVLRARRAGALVSTAETVRELLEQGRTSPLTDGTGLDAGWAESLIAEVQSGRSRG